LQIEKFPFLGLLQTEIYSSCCCFASFFLGSGLPAKAELEINYSSKSGASSKRFIFLSKSTSASP